MLEGRHADSRQQAMGGPVFFGGDSVRGEAETIYIWTITAV